MIDNSKYNNSYDQLADLRADMKPAMKALKENLDASKVISDNDLRKAIRKGSNWLNKLVTIEIISIPLILLILFASAYVLKMNILCIIVMIIPLILDVVADRKTLAISSKLIQNESLLDMASALEHQKIIRKKQTLIASPFAFAWLGWFLYEYLKSPIFEIPADALSLVWIIVFAFFSLVSLLVILIIYRKAQRTNDEMIDKINSFLSENE